MYVDKAWWFEDEEGCGNTSGSTSYNYAYLLFYSSEFIIPKHRQESSSRCSSSQRCSQGGGYRAGLVKSIVSGIFQAPTSPELPLDIFLTTPLQ